MDILLSDKCGKFRHSEERTTQYEMVNMCIRCSSGSYEVSGLNIEKQNKLKHVA